jgi:hypothetical protein
VVNSGDRSTYGMEKDSVGEATSHTVVAVFGGADCAARGPGRPDRKIPAPGALRRTTATGTRSSKRKFLAVNIFPGRDAFLNSGEILYAFRTPRATLPPFLSDDGYGEIVALSRNGPEAHSAHEKQQRNLVQPGSTWK